MGRFDGRRLSLPRLAVLVTVIAGLTYAGTSSWRYVQDAQAASSNGAAWYAAYVDATVTPLYEFEQPTTKADRDIVLSFVVASQTSTCEPAWGGAYSLDAASDDLDLDRRIARLRQQGGSVVVSFGGAVNSELSTTCTDPAALVDAYRSVVERYDLRTIDLDIEGAQLGDTTATTRRAVAMKALQVERAKAGKNLRVWLTLPVSPEGLSTEGRQVVAAMLEQKVDLSGVNVMTMDYGASRAKGQSMLDASTAALTATHRQLSQVYARAGQDVGSATLWRRMGATPMVGQNDVPGEIFSIAAARRLSAFAAEKGLGRMSMWSLNRDRTCGANYPDLTVVSNSCSGVNQGSDSFATLLRGTMTGTPDKTEVAPTATPTGKPTGGRDGADMPLADDPSTSPYPIWAQDETYVEGTRVVWHRNAYVAKWWSLGDVPDDPVVDESASPWRLIGPVLPGEKPIVLPVLPVGTYPAWDQDVAYRKGERVMLKGTPFVAKWYSAGTSPDARSTQNEPSPWRQLTDAELRLAAKVAAEGTD
ncbi:glycosyl hydrolase family 18 protein [Aeromicrobium fastidiosum]|uniref:Glycosyl hydrolase family 18 n=1 Tax=Aeromicrobium fastidiosum TaxID=52699 RepID=A0A641AHX4_9ACTN|nr:glycosyl hydrolase family 18 protein [Aeromicrobium fastidiosum]KAA1373710.1 glycosyl hydrolase family 18 [Aeromicrobium fastidiosum]MBP2391271.1 chitinase [Aeromicrobium fastidiosum]